MRRALALMSLVGLCSCADQTITHLDPPPVGQGFQLKVPEFTVDPGQEIQACYFYQVPGTPDQEVWVNRYQVAQPVGSHHMNLFRVKTVKNLIPDVNNPVVSVNGMGECFKSSNWSDWPLVVNSQQDSEVDWKLPDGVGAKFNGGDMLMLQTHWVNATTQQTPGKATVSVNLWTMAAPPPNELGTLFATNQNIRVCPGDVNPSFTKTCTFRSQGINIVAANGHFHSRGKLFEMYAVDAAGQQGDKFYTSTSWNDPPMTRDINTQLPAGGGVMWSCSYAFPTGACGNPADSCCYTFGGQVETQEHCNAFVYYWPKTVDVNCF